MHNHTKQKTLIQITDNQIDRKKVCKKRYAHIFYIVDIDILFCTLVLVVFGGQGVELSFVASVLCGKC